MVVDGRIEEHCEGGQKMRRVPFKGANYLQKNL